MKLLGIQKTYFLSVIVKTIFNVSSYKVRFILNRCEMKLKSPDNDKCRISNTKFNRN